ncbi:MAG: hypothetical protein O8C67_00285 [Candidatus Methanoperedens sp.]|nr:hypothetical protein [Candidatus Methanoperedens sp.]
MRGYPKVVKSKEDFEHLLSMPEHKTQALADLKALQIHNDSKISVSISETESSEITNPTPRFKQYGFSTKANVDALIGKFDEATIPQVLE